MKKLTSSQIRQMWLDFYQSKGHKIEPSASLVPHDDATLLWTNAGVTPLKNILTVRLCRTIRVLPTRKNVSVPTILKMSARRPVIILF